VAKDNGGKKKGGKGAKKLAKAASPAKDMGRRDLSLAVMNCVPWLYFRLQAEGQEIGAVNAQRGGTWGMLNSVITQAPQTVPQLARARPVSRQHIQKLANEMVADGLIRFVPNPAHRRSQLIEATPKGLDAYARMNSSLGELADMLGDGFSKEELFVAASVLERMRAKLAENQGGGGAPGALPISLAAE
jgi:DNA-binding MarR family transcriptional regulator